MKVITPKVRHTIIHNFIGGIAWALGITVGISALAFLLTIIMNALGGLPLVGEWLAELIEVTLGALNRR